jgi:hypothetical protein
VEDKRTRFALQALDLVELFQIHFGAEKLAAPDGATYHIGISAPEGPSTGGGKQAVQHVTLVPTEGRTLGSPPKDGGGLPRVIVAGNVNQVDKTADLRTWGYLAHVHAQRFKGAEIPLDRAQYEPVLGRMKSFFTQQGYKLVVSDAPELPGPPTESMPVPGAGAATTWKLVAAALALAIVGLLVVLLKRH